MRNQSTLTGGCRTTGPPAPRRRFARLRAAAPIVLIALLLAGGSCRRRGEIPWPELGDTGQAAGAGIELHARFLPSGTEIERLFKWHMPDSGVVPVQVSLRNSDVVPLTVHCWGDIMAEGSFTGFSLLARDREAPLLDPLAVLQRRAGTAEHISYDRSQKKKIISGALLPPLGGYFIYREFKVGRYYRPLLKHSFFESLPSGLIVPRTLEPGETARGYIYFALEDDLNPYVPAAAAGAARDSVVAVPASGRGATGAADEPAADGTDSGERAADDEDLPAPPIELRERYELVLASHRPPVFAESLPVYDAFFPSRNPPTVRRGAGSPAPGISGVDAEGVFALALHVQRSGMGDVLFGFGRVGELADSFDDSFHVISSLSGTHARIADAAMRGSRIVCALDFRGKSRIYLFDTAARRPRRTVRNVLLPRRTRHLFLSDDVVLVVTDDEFCRALSLTDLTQRRSIRLGHAVKGVTLCGDRLVAFDGMRGICVYGTTGETLLDEIGRYELPKCGDIDIAVCDPARGALAVLHRGSDDAGDTLVVHTLGEKTGLRERGRLPLPAPVHAFHGRGSDCMLHLDGGLLLRLDLAAVIGAGVDDEQGDAGERVTGGAPGDRAGDEQSDDSDGGAGDIELVRAAGYIPVILEAVTRTDTGLIGIGKGGVLVRGALRDFLPRPSDARISRSVVTVLERARPE